MGIGQSHLQRFREANSALSWRGKNVLVVGGTGGIGAAAALRFAQLGASVTIAGRNKTAGEAIVEKMTNVAPDSQTRAGNSNFHYIAVDTTVIADVKRFTSEYTSLNKEQGLHILLITSGGLNVGPRRETVDGVEHNFSISYLGRFLLINRLLPLLLQNQGARVMSVMSAGQGGPIDNLDDPEMKAPGTYGKLKSASYNSMANDLMMDELTVRHKDKDIAFYHMFPGMVATNIMSNNNVPLASVMDPLVRCIATKPEDYAETVVYIATSDEFGSSKSGTSLNEKAEAYKPHEFRSNPENREKLWRYSVETSRLNED